MDYVFLMEDLMECVVFRGDWGENSPAQRTQIRRARESKRSRTEVKKGHSASYKKQDPVLILESNILGNSLLVPVSHSV